MSKSLLTVNDLTREELYKMFELAAKLKRERGKDNFKPLAGKTIGMIFAKSSTRTRVSFEVGIQELGGYPMYLEQNKMQVGRGETVADTARVLGRYLHGIVIRTFEHADVEELAAESGVPVINALTNDYHPCQILTDLFTIYEFSGKVEGVKLVYCGDGDNNMANSFILGAGLSGVELVIAAPEAYKPDQELMTKFPNVSWEEDPVKAVEGADYIYTDVWVSMGFEEEKAERFNELHPYQVNSELLKHAKPEVKILHCLPAHRGEEITDEVMDSDKSIVFDQAENRLHTQKAVLTMLFNS
ncbi:ornithine carbamoyltransferase [Lentisphaerota bacterium ZTH]|nr:ornithine carbamoyltransferase [Lentisphaerota bacterium]WET07594.1 ornithine carbamoyltransferase [Lentisphaerota bacterium ZTH]